MRPQSSVAVHTLALCAITRKCTAGDLTISDNLESHIHICHYSNLSVKQDMSTCISTGNIVVDVEYPKCGRGAITRVCCWQGNIKTAKPYVGAMSSVHMSIPTRMTLFR